MFISIENVWHTYKNSKTTREDFLGQDLSIHVNHSSIHLVIQSLKCVEDKGKIFFENLYNRKALKAELVYTVPVGNYSSTCVEIKTDEPFKK
jgi:hypothetical protein